MKNLGLGRVQQQVSSTIFFGKHDDLLKALFRIPNRNRSGTLRRIAGGKTRDLLPEGVSGFLIAVNQLEAAGFSRILEAAAQENSPEAFKKALMVLLSLLSVKAPEGVFIPTPKRRGRKTETHTFLVVALWDRLGRPETGNDACAEIAKAVFPTPVGVPRKSKDLKKQIALVRAAIKRFLGRPESQIRNSAVIP